MMVQLSNTLVMQSIMLNGSRVRLASPTSSLVIISRSLTIATNRSTPLFALLKYLSLINLSFIAKKANYDETFILSILEKLKSLEIIDYHKKNNDPLFVIHSNKLESDKCPDFNFKNEG
mgnify:CR=1 FL=1